MNSYQIPVRYRTAEVFIKLQEIFERKAQEDIIRNQSPEQLGKIKNNNNVLFKMTGIEKGMIFRTK